MKAAAPPAAAEHAEYWSRPAGELLLALGSSEQGLSAPRDVRLGEQTLDEMCLGIFGLAQKVSDLLK